jgi:hypothetical protein
MKILTLLALLGLSWSPFADGQTPQGTILLVKPSATSPGHAKRISQIEQVDGEFRVWSGPADSHRLLIRIDLLEPEYARSLRDSLNTGAVLDVSVCFSKRENTKTAFFVNYENLTYVKKHTWFRCAAAPSGEFTVSLAPLLQADYFPITPVNDIEAAPFLFTVEGNHVAQYFKFGPFIRR